MWFHLFSLLCVLIIPMAHLGPFRLIFPVASAGVNISVPAIVIILLTLFRAPKNLMGIFRKCARVDINKWEMVVFPHLEVLLQFCFFWCGEHSRTLMIIGILAQINQIMQISIWLLSVFVLRFVTNENIIIVAAWKCLWQQSARAW